MRIFLNEYDYERATKARAPVPLYIILQSFHTCWQHSWRREEMHGWTAATINHAAGVTPYVSSVASHVASQSGRPLLIGCTCM